jgi:hypothetical protein
MYEELEDEQWELIAPLLPLDKRRADWSPGMTGIPSPISLSDHHLLPGHSIKNFGIGSWKGLCNRGHLRFA